MRAFEDMLENRDMMRSDRRDKGGYGDLIHGMDVFKGTYFNSKFKGRGESVMRKETNSIMTGMRIADLNRYQIDMFRTLSHQLAAQFKFGTVSQSKKLQREYYAHIEHIANEAMTGNTEALGKIKKMLI